MNVLKPIAVSLLAIAMFGCVNHTNNTNSVESPTTVVKNTNIKSSPLAEYFTSYFLMYSTYQNAGNTEFEDNTAFKECIAKPYPVMAGQMKQLLSTVFGKETMTEMNESLQQDSRGMGTAMAVMTSMLISELENHPEKLPSGAKEQYTQLKNFGKVRYDECQGLLR